MSRKRKSSRNIVYIIIILIALSAAVYVVFYRYELVQGMPDKKDFFIPTNIPQSTPQNIPRYHAHVDFKVFINGEEIDFAKPEYDFANPLIHLHVRNYEGGSVIHIESSDVTIGDFFLSLDMELSKDCFSIKSKNYCSNKRHTMKFYVNGIKNDEYEDYKPKDIDKILISYGDDSNNEIKVQLNSITNLACAFSGKCPFPEEAEGKIVYN